MDDFVDAEMYDQMINWDSRLARELPVIAEFLPSGRILDVACSSGRHSFGLVEKGFQTLGVDISEHFIEFAKDLATELDKTEQTEFIAIDAAGEDIRQRLAGQYFDGAILLGNAIANMGSFTKGQQLIRNIFTLLRPGAGFFVQTVNKPLKPWYNPLRQKDGVIIQRIMIPETDREADHNIVLHVNQIDAEKLEYVKQKADNEFFMYRKDEFESLLHGVGFEVEQVYSSYSKKDVKDIDGETLIWMLRKPEIELKEAGIALFDSYAGFDREEIIKRTLAIWQKLMSEKWYHCLRGYRFLYPRITAHPKYQQIIQQRKSEPILDVACNTGTDLRQLYIDGATDLMGVDQVDTFIDAGYDLFGDRGECPIDFVVADLLSDDFLQIEQGEVIGGKFAKYVGHFSVIHAGSLLHLLTEDEVTTIVERMKYLLKDGGIFFGRTVGSTTAGEHEGGLRYLHDVASLTSVFNLVGYSSVEVDFMPRDGPIGERTTNTTTQLSFYATK